MMIVNIPGSGSLTCASLVAPPKVNWAAPSTRVNSTSIICPSISSSIFIGVVLFCLFKQLAIPQPLAILPRAIFVAEVYPLAKRRMAGLPQFDQDVRTRDAQVLLLQFNERRPARVVITQYLKSEPVGFMFVVAREGQSDRRDDQ